MSEEPTPRTVAEIIHALQCRADSHSGVLRDGTGLRVYGPYDHQLDEEAAEALREAEQVRWFAINLVSALSALRRLYGTGNENDWPTIAEECWAESQHGTVSDILYWSTDE